MTLPASGTISLNDIRVELQQASTNVSLGDMSNLVGFVDPDAVSEFYGYSYPLYNTLGINDIPKDTYEDACGLAGLDKKTVYFAGGGGTPACPAQGVTLYTSSALTTVYNGGGFWWRSKQCNAAYSITSGGVLVTIQGC